MPSMSELKQTSARSLCGIAVLVLGAWCAGCGESGPTLYPVKGQVVYKDNGAPFKGGTSVKFESKEPPYVRAASALDAEGRFELATEQRSGTGAMAGPHRVSISYITPDGAYIQDQLSKQIDPKYFEFSTSGLEVDIKPDQPNDFKIELERAKK
jgi:hypothetical protein